MKIIVQFSGGKDSQACLIYACNKLLCNTKKLVDPTVYDDSYISSKYRNRVINMRDRINKLIKEYEKE